MCNKRVHLLVKRISEDQFFKDLLFPVGRKVILCNKYIHRLLEEKQAIPGEKVL